jgi:membrane-bound serine protease (ClpP class)
LKSVVSRALLAGAAALALCSAASAATPRVLAIRYDLEVNPVTQGYLSHELHQAAKQHYAAAVILLDTPGGLSDSMRKIVQDELSLPIPVIVYVSPKGARAASAGVWISEAADLLAMAPETNIGSSTPINGNGQNIGSDLRRKVINDAAASLRSLAKSHGRNARWADSAVRKASNLTEAEALKLHVIDMLAPSLDALLAKADGYRTNGPGRAYTLHLAGAKVVTVSPSFFTRVLNTLIDPNLISLLFLAGLAGIGYEIFHPGVVLPGALGGISLVIALFGFSVLPTSWAGLVLVLLGVALLVVDAHVVSHGALTLSGLISLVAGLLLLFHTAPAPYHTSVPLVASVAATLGLFWAVAISKAVQVRRRPVSVGPQHIVGKTGEVREGGLVFVNGELWQARTPDGSPLEPGEHVTVEGVDGLTLTVS